MIPVRKTDLLTPEEAAAHLGFTYATLADWRCKGGGPKFLKFGEGRGGRVRYRPEDLAAWSAERERASTTSGGKRA
jgi:predicted site-specific integrase-resolvase